MTKQTLYENYPLWRVLIYNFVILSVYAAGLYLMFKLHKWAGILFIFYLLFVEFSVYKGGCRYCYYYGKMCVAGRGKIVPLIFKKGEPKKFCERTLSFKDFIPSLLVAFIPVVAGVYLMIKEFSWLILVITLWPLIINFAGNPILYGKIACPHCKQGAKCCPACEYFMKKTKANENDKKK